MVARDQDQGTGRMIDRRKLVLAGLAGAMMPLAARAEAPAPRIVRIPRSFLPREIDVNPELPAGQIHVDTGDTWLYWTLGDARAIRYKIAVGAPGRNFTGLATVQRKAEWPSWVPTRSMIELEPEVYGPYAGGLPGGHDRNPLGARALYLYQGGRDTYYRIHGTPQPWTMGQSFSSGCVRLINEHMIDLYDRVPVGTPVFAG
jgi:lipoprotein-anchoring transpeptidase ErfK/SrfK